MRRETDGEERQDESDADEPLQPRRVLRSLGAEQAAERELAGREDRLGDPEGLFRPAHEGANLVLSAGIGPFLQQVRGQFEGLVMSARTLVISGEHLERVEVGVRPRAGSLQEVQQMPRLIQVAGGHLPHRHALAGRRQVGLEGQGRLI
jgi:hypothetical protein